MCRFGYAHVYYCIVYRTGKRIQKMNVNNIINLQWRSLSAAPFRAQPSYATYYTAHGDSDEVGYKHGIMFRDAMADLYERANIMLLYSLNNIMYLTQFVYMYIIYDFSKNVSTRYRISYYYV